MNSEDGVVRSTEEHVTAEGLASIRGVLFPAGTVLLAMYGSVGKVALAGTDLSTNQAILGIQVKDKQRLDAGYLRHWLIAMKPRLEARANGVTQQNISAGIVRALEIPLPPLPEQRRIAAVLDKAHAVGRKRTHATRMVDELLLTAFIELFEGDGESSTWPTMTLEEIVQDSKLGLVRASTRLGSDGNASYIRMDAITRDGRLDLSRVLRTAADETELAAYSLRRGDLLFNTRNSRELVGKMGRFDGGQGFVYNNNLMRLRLRECVLPEFLVSAWTRPQIARQLENMKSGTTSVFAIYWKSLRELVVSIPPLSVQQRFVGLYTRMTELRRRFDTAMRASDSLFLTLASNAFG